MSARHKVIPIRNAYRDDEQAQISSCADAEPYALRVIGDSMEPEFADGHVIIVDPAMPPSNGAFVVIDVGGETTFRQFVVDGGRKFVKPLNPRYATVEIIGEYRVRGVVVQRAGRRRRDHKHYY